MATGEPELLVQSVHAQKIKDVSFSLDGLWLVVTIENDLIKTWEVATGRQVATTGGHDRQVKTEALSPQAEWLARARKDGTIELWEVRTFREAHTLSGHTERVNAVAFSPDGRRLASGGRDHTVRVWDVPGVAELHTSTGHHDDVTDVAFSPDGRWLASGSRDHTVKLWDVGTGQEQRTLIGHRDAVMAVTFSPDGRWLASGGLDGTTRIWDPAIGQEIALLSSMRKSNGWVVVSPTGLFDGSPDALQRLAVWRFGGNETMPLETFFNDFYYPGLLAELLSGRRPEPPREVSQLDLRRPVVKVRLAEGQASDGSAASRTVRVKLDVTQAPADGSHPVGSGVRNVRLLRDGVLVKAWRGDVLEAYEQGEFALDADVQIAAGKNHFTAYALNRHNIKGADATLVVSGAQTLKRPGTAYILTVGINRYANRSYNLRYAAADARAFGEAWRRQLGELRTYQQIEVIPLLNQAATRVNIVSALQRLAGQRSAKLPPTAPAALRNMRPAQPEDAVIVYFAGHGISRKDRTYLIPHDLGHGGGRAELNGAGLKVILAHSISDLDLGRALEEVDAGWLLLVIDACDPAQALAAVEKRRGPMNSKGLAQLAYEKGIYILAAAQGYQAALEASRQGHGYLAHALLEGLGHLVADRAPRNGLVDVREWLAYATLRVPQLQVAGMQEGRKLGKELAFVDGEQSIRELKKRSVQRPRVFFPRQLKGRPLLVAKPEAGP